MRLIGLNIKQMLKKWTTWLLLLFPVLLAVGAGGLIEKQGSEIGIPVVFVDKDNSTSSKFVVNRLKKQDLLDVSTATQKEAFRRLGQNKVDSVFIIEEGFEEKIKHEEREGVIKLVSTPSSLTYHIVRELVASEVTRLTSNAKAANRVIAIYDKRKMNIDKEEVWKDAYRYSDDQWEPEPLMTIEYKQEGEKFGNRETKGSFNSYLGLWSFSVLLLCFVMNEWILKERLLFSRMRTTYKGLAAYLYGKLGSQLLFLFGSAALSFGVLSYFHHTPMNIKVLVSMIIFSLFSSMLSMFMASFIRSSGNYYLLSFLVVMMISAFGGSFFPLSDFSPSLAHISAWMPQSLFVKASFAHEYYYSFSAFIIGISVILWGGTVWKIQKQKR
jgi:ABC-2 type transport system permease protein